MLEKLLSNTVYKSINNNFDNSFIEEVRLRINCPVVVKYKGTCICLKDEFGSLMVADRQDIERVISVASNYSLYTVENQIKQAFITAEKGYRIGLSGEIITEFGENIKSLKNIYSVNIRVPHIILNCSFCVYKMLKINGAVGNTLILSPPGAGKTTLIRDLSYQLSKEKIPLNVLLLDERYEIAGVKNGVPTIKVGDCCDILSGSTKEFGFNQGIRSLAPDVIITDEIGSILDSQSIYKAINSGVRVIATIHAESIDMLKDKVETKDLLNNQCFDRYVVLSKNGFPGKLEGIYDKNLKCIYY